MLEDPVHELVDAVVVVGADGHGIAHAQLVELGRGELPVVVVRLVGCYNHGFLGGPQTVGHGQVYRSDAFGDVGDENDYVGVGHGHFGLFLHLLADGALWVGFQPAGVHQDEPVVVPRGVGHEAVPRGAGYFGHDGVSPTDNPVEQGGLSHVGPADYGNYWKGHIRAGESKNRF